LQSDCRKCLNSKNSAARGVSEGFCRHDADAQSGVAAWADINNHAVHITRVPRLLFEQFRDGRRQITGVPSRFVEPAHGEHLLAFGQGHLADAAGGLDNQESWRSRGHSL